MGAREARPHVPRLSSCYFFAWAREIRAIFTTKAAEHTSVRAYSRKKEYPMDTNEQDVLKRS